jgi:peptidase C25-like protein
VPYLQPQAQQPLLLTMNCLNGFFHFPPLNSLSEALLKAQGKGVVGAISPSGLSVNDPAHVFHKALLQEILSGRHERLGDAVLAAQEAYAQTGALPEILSIYNLLADPALRIR